MTERCAPAAQRRGDSAAGTAAPATRWLLVEQPGPWGRDALTQSQLDPDVARALGERARRQAGLRLLLIRRPGRTDDPGPRGWVYVGDPTTARWGRVARPSELLDLPLDDSAGEPVDRPVYLVCAHGRHDPCCAIRGRPVAAALAALRPDATWECSHVGGDRFAANVVVLPHGLYYGHVPADSAADLVAATEAGEVVPGWLRGRAGLPAAIQAAQTYARRLLDARGHGDLAPSGVDEPAPGLTRVQLRHGVATVAVTVRGERGPDSARLTCASTRSVPVPAWRLVSLEPAAVSTG